MLLELRELCLSLEEQREWHRGLARVVGGILAVVNEANVRNDLPSSGVALVENVDGIAMRSKRCCFLS